jgi:hypothetical protein
MKKKLGILNEIPMSKTIQICNWHKMGTLYVNDCLDLECFLHILSMPIQTNVVMNQVTVNSTVTGVAPFILQSAGA